MNASQQVQLRCSSLPLVAACAASLDGDVRVNQQSPEALLGTLVHDWLSCHILGQRRSMVLPEGIDRDEFEVLCRLGKRCWDSLSPFFPAPSVELPLAAPLGSIMLTGHADVLSLELQPTDGLGEVRVCDWKTGREDFNHDDQLRGYALLALETYQDAESVSVAVCRVRYQTADWGHFTRSEIKDWWERLSDRVLREKRNYAPGRWCSYCPRNLSCPARTALLEQAVTAITATDPSETSLSCITPERLGSLYDSAKAVEKLLASALEQIKATVVAYGGRVRTGDGRELVITESERRSIDVAKGLETLTEAIGWDRVLPMLKIGKGDVEKAVGDLAPRGRKGIAGKELMARLEAQDAVRIDTTQRLECRRNVNDTTAAAISHAGATSET